MRYILVSLLLLLAPDMARAEFVGGLDPAGDNYLALRTGPGSTFEEILRMEPGTIVEILESNGKWRRLRLLDGTEGWAFGKFIKPGFPSVSDTPDANGPEDAAAPDEAGGETDVGDDADQGKALTGQDGDPQTPPVSPAPGADIDGVMQDIVRGLDENG